MSFELTGKLIEKFEEKQVTDKFKKREFVIEKTENNFSDQIKFQLVQDKTNLIDPFQIGDDLKIQFNIRGNKWKDNFFVNLQAWRIENISNQSTGTNEEMPPPPEKDLPPAEDYDDLPF